jgi:hypothetical protein
MTDRELLQQALRYMDSVGKGDMYVEDWEIAEAIRTRLEQPDSVLFTEFKGDHYAWWRDDDGKLKLCNIPKPEPEETVDGWPLYSGIPKPKENNT